MTRRRPLRDGRINRIGGLSIAEYMARQASEDRGRRKFVIDEGQTSNAGVQPPTEADR